MVMKIKTKKANNGKYIPGENIISLMPGIFTFLSTIFSKPLPIETTKKVDGIIPIKVAKKKFFIFTLNKVGNMQLNCHGMPPIKR